MPCNGTKDKEVMGNLNTQSWDELWSSQEAEAVRKKVRCCDRNCWMIGSVSPAMHKYIWVPAAWVIWHKFKALFMKKPYSMYENKIPRLSGWQGDKGAAGPLQHLRPKCKGKRWLKRRIPRTAGASDRRRNRGRRYRKTDCRAEKVTIECTICEYSIVMNKMHGLQVERKGRFVC